MHICYVTERLIDLGVPDDAAWQDTVELSPAAPGPPSRRWPAVLAVLAFIGLFSVGSLPVAGVAAMAEVPGRALSFSADAENFYALRGGPSITAYGWRDGQVRWSQSLDRDDGQLYLAAGRPFIRHRPCTQVATHGWSLESLDPKTGRARWIRPGGPLAVLAGQPGTAPSLLMVDEPNASCPVVRTSASGRVMQSTPTRLSALDADTGRVRWTFDLQGGRLAVSDTPNAAWFAVWYQGGRAEIRDSVTGRVLAGAVLPELTDHAPLAVRVIGDLLIVVSPETDGVTLNAYKAKNVSLVWRQHFRPTPPAPLSDLTYGPTVVGCGPMICIPTWRDVVVINPADGANQWRRDLQLDEVGSGVLVARQRSEFLHARIVDWKTGKDLVDLPGWGTVPMVSDDSLVGQATPPRYALVQHPEGEKAELATIDLQTGQLRSLGSVSPMPSRCALQDRRLSCLIRGDSIQLWRLPA
jgi:outer membrane protein assembly factor BamB